MLIEEEPKEEPKLGEINSDVLEAVLEEDIVVEDIDVVLVPREEEEELDEIDIAFLANDEGYW